MPNLLSAAGNATGQFVGMVQSGLGNAGSAIVSGGSSILNNLSGAYGAATAAAKTGISAVESGGASLLSGAAGTVSSGVQQGENIGAGIVGGIGGIVGGIGSYGTSTYGSSNANVAGATATQNVLGTSGGYKASNLTSDIAGSLDIMGAASLGAATGSLFSKQKSQAPLMPVGLSDLFGTPMRTPAPAPVAGISTRGNAYGTGGQTPQAWAEELLGPGGGQAYLTGIAQYNAQQAARTNAQLNQEIGGLNLPAPFISKPSSFTTIVPEGNTYAAAIPNSKIVYESPGEFGIYQEVFNPGGTPFWNLVGGGSVAALQSGAFTAIKPETPVVFTQASAGTSNPILETGLATYPGEPSAAAVLANPSAFSRLGSEAYGGYVLPLNPKTTVQSTGAELSTFANPYNLANLVNPQAVNLPKSQQDLYSLPWSISASSPAIQVLGAGGLKPASLAGTELGNIAPAAASIFVPAPAATTATATKSGGGNILSNLLGADISALGNVYNIFGGGTGANAETTPSVSFGAIGGTMTPVSYSGKSTAGPNPILTTLFEGSLANLDAITSLPSTLTMGKVQKWTPGADFLAGIGASGSSRLTAAQSTIASAEADLSAGNALGTKIQTEQSQIEALTAGNLNTKDEFTGSDADFAKLTQLTTQLNSDVAQYNKYNSEYTAAYEQGVSSGAFIPLSGGGYTVASSAARPYGMYSDWSASVQKAITGLSPDQFTSYEQTPQFKSSGAFNQFAEGVTKNLTNPQTALQEVTSGVALYGGGEVLGLGAEAIGVGTDALGLTAGNTGILGRIPSAVGSIISSPITKVGVLGLYTGAGVYQAAGGFSLEGGLKPNVGWEQFTSNLGGLTGGAYAMGAGALGASASPRIIEGAAAATESGLGELNYRLSDVKQYNIDAAYQTRLTPKSPSGLAFDVDYTGTVKTLTPYKIAGVPVFPRIFDTGVTEGVDISKTYDADVFGARNVGGMETPVLSGVRSVSAEVVESPFSELAHGEGTLNIAETRLKSSFGDYIKMGTEDARLQNLEPENVINELIQQGTSTTPLTTGYRVLDVYGEKGSSFEDLFNWSATKTGGTQLEFNAINPDDFSTRMSVDYFGSKPGSRGSILLQRTVTEEGLGEGGVAERSGSQTAEARIIRYLQEKPVKTGSPEDTMVFNQRGQNILDEVAEQGQVSGQALLNTENAIASELNEGGTASAAHSHPNYPASIYGEALVDSLRYGNLRLAAGILSHFIFRSEISDMPSGGDYRYFSNNPEGVTAEYISTPKSILKVSPFEGGRGWRPYDAVADAMAPLEERVEMGEPVFAEERIQNGINAGGRVQSIGRTTVYSGPSESYQAANISEEMGAEYPAGVRNMFADMIDRVVSGNPNLEFVRETNAERSLSESGSNLGRNTGIRGGRLSSPSASMLGRYADEGTFSEPIASSRAISRPSARLSSAERAEAFNMQSSEIPSSRVLTEEFPTARIFGGIPSLTSRESILSFAPASASSSIRAATPVSRQRQNLNTRQGIDFVNAYEVISSPRSTVAQRNKQGVERVTAFDQLTERARAYDQVSDLDELTTPLNDIRSMFALDQVPASLQLSGLLSRQLQQEYTQQPPPKKPTPTGLLALPGASAPGGFLASNSRKSYNPFLEIIPLRSLLR